MSKYKAVLFDCDGTLVDTNSVILASWDHTFMTYLGRHVTPEEVLGTFGEPLEESMERIFAGIDPKQTVATYRKFQYEYWDKEIEYFPGIAEMLAGLRKAGVKTGIVTSRYWESTAIRPFNLKDRDEYWPVIDPNSTDKKKPNPEPCLKALEVLGMDKSEVLMVGDSKHDIACGRNAGLKTVLVGWSLAYQKEDATGMQIPDYTIETPEELLEIVLG